MGTEDERTMLIGREDALKRIKGTMDEVEASKGGFLLLSGEAGIGKTSIAYHALDLARAKGWTVMSGECLFREGAEPYLPIVKAIKSSQKERERKRQTESTEDWPMTMPMGLMAIGNRSTASSQRSRSTNEFKMDRDRMFINVVDFLEKESRAVPLLFFLDDLHWADDATLQLLFYLIRSLTRTKVMILGAYRPEDVKASDIRHPMVDFRNRLSDEGLGKTLEVGRFSIDETTRFIRSLLGPTVPDVLVKRVHGQAGGNPYFIEQFIQATKEKGGSEGEDKALSIPSTVSIFITERLHRLGKDEQKVLELGAVIGQEFRYDLILCASGMDEDRLVTSVERLMDHGILEETEVDSKVFYHFKHNLLREVAYDHLSRTKRRLIHGKVGTCLDQAYKGRTEQVVFPLAYHFSKTSKLSKALEYNIMAGKVAMKAFALEEAKRYLESALDMILKSEDEDDAQQKEVEILNMLARISDILGEWRKGMDHLHQALVLCEEGSIEKALTYRNIGEIEMNRYEWELAIEAFHSSITIYEQFEDPRGLAENFRCLAWISEEVGNHEKALMYGNRAIEEAKKIGDTYLVGKAIIDIGNSYNVKNEYDRALQYYNDALMRLDPDRDLDQISRAYNNIGDIFMKQGKYKESIEQFERCLDFQKITGDLMLKGFVVGNIGESLFKMGEVERARPYVEEAMQILERVDNKFMMAMMLIIMSKIMKEEGDLDASEGFLMEAIWLGEKHNLPVGHASACLEYGIFLKEKGDKEKAREQFQKALTLYEQMESKLSIERVRKELEDL